MISLISIPIKVLVGYCYEFVKNKVILHKFFRGALSWYVIVIAHDVVSQCFYGRCGKLCLIKIAV